MACCEIELTELDKYTSKFWEFWLHYVSDRVCDAENYECFFKADQAQLEYDKISEVQYLFAYLSLLLIELREKKKNTFSIAGVDCDDTAVDTVDFYKNFNLGCMQDFFDCERGIDITNLLETLGLSPEDLDGINYMIIENTDPCENTFRIS